MDWLLWPTYVGGSLLIVSSPSDCNLNVEATIKLLLSLGFYNFTEESSFFPSTDIKFIGFIVNSNTIMVYFPEDKKSKIKENFNDLLETKNYSIQLLASFIGLWCHVVVNAMKCGALHYRALERNKISALGKSCGSYDGWTRLSVDALNDLDW